MTTVARYGYLEAHAADYDVDSGYPVGPRTTVRTAPIPLRDLCDMPDERLLAIARALLRDLGDSNDRTHGDRGPT
jgi:hypothetical protein